MKLRSILGYLLAAAQVLLLGSTVGCFGRPGEGSKGSTSSGGTPSTSATPSTALDPAAEAARLRKEAEAEKLRKEAEAERLRQEAEAEAEKAKIAAEVKVVHDEIESSFQGILRTQSYNIFEGKSAKIIDQEWDKLLTGKNDYLRKRYEDSKKTEEYTNLLKAYEAVDFRPNSVEVLDNWIKAGAEVVQYMATPDSAQEIENATRAIADAAKEVDEAKDKLTAKYEELFPPDARTRPLTGDCELRFSPGKKDVSSHSFDLLEKGKVKPGFRAKIAGIDPALFIDKDKNDFAETIRLEEASSQKSSAYYALLDNMPGRAATFDKPEHERNVGQRNEITRAEAAYLGLWK